MRYSASRSALGAFALTMALLGGAVPAAAAPAAVRAASVNMHTLTCYETEDTSGGDEVYIQINGQTVWSSADSIDCDHNAPATRPVNRLAKTGDTISLYDSDFPDADDHLGSDTIEGDRGTLVFNLDDALYTLDYGPA
ncbi:hypothetical protein [Spirillospora sp. NPDC047279]|uniref:hypothetical protein n=1 Tax=Spirillospora sp. NPDC047279 TaxID=3155478 RepID=UPI00340889A2